jgi:hypothetical protein
MRQAAPRTPASDAGARDRVRLNSPLACGRRLTPPAAAGGSPSMCCGRGAEASGAAPGCGGDFSDSWGNCLTAKAAGAFSSRAGANGTAAASALECEASTSSKEASIGNASVGGGAMCSRGPGVPRGRLRGAPEAVCMAGAAAVVPAPAGRLLSRSSTCSSRAPASSGTDPAWLEPSVEPCACFEGRL